MNPRHKKQGPKQPKDQSSRDGRGESRPSRDSFGGAAGRPGAGVGRSAQRDDGGQGFVFRDRSGKIHVRTVGSTAAASTRGPSHSAVRHGQPVTGHPSAKTGVLMPDSQELRSGSASKKKKQFKTQQEIDSRIERAPSDRRDIRDERSQGYGRGYGRTQDRDRKGKREEFARPGKRTRSEKVSERVRSQEDRTTEGRKVRAVIDKNRKGFAFLVYDSRELEDAFIPPRDADSFFHGDRVEVTLSRSGQVLDIRVLSHRFRELVGRYFPVPAGRGRGANVVYERKRAREEVYCPNPHPQAQSGDWVRCRLDFEEGVSGEVVEVYGTELPPRADVGMVAAEYNLIEEHSEAAEAEARTFKLDLEDPNRRDLRGVPFITIDGETARDFDDAVYVEREGANFVLWVAIADVSHYVRPGTALDEEALSRGTSVYFPERAFHMLPRALSENLCSLRPNEPRLTMVARMVYDRHGKRHETKVMEALIESRRRATYNEIQAEWEQNRGNSDWEFTPHFDLYQIIRKQRSGRGSIDFDLPEAEMKVRPTGEVDSIKIRSRLDAHRLIEEFMIAANEAVTEWMLERAWPFVYRTHEEPSEQALERFATLAWHVGVEIKFHGGTLHEQLVRVLEKVEGHPAQTLLNTAMLRSMKQAVYSAVHAPHFGLASTGYTHFTSPIRRYPDLVVHRLLRWALQVERGQKNALSREDKAALERELDEICEHCSYRERLASDAERESIKLKQVRAMLDQAGKEFEGRVIGMVEAGFFVQITDPYVEGMVGRDSLDDDFYQFDEEKMVFSGRRRNRQFRIGDDVKVRSLKADIDTRTIDFELVSHEPTPGVTPLQGEPPRPSRGPGVSPGKGYGRTNGRDRGRSHDGDRERRSNRHRTSDRDDRTEFGPGYGGKRSGKFRGGQGPGQGGGGHFRKKGRKGKRR